MTGAPIFVDANVFMYAAGVAHPYKPPCVRILADLEQGKLATAINTEIVQEMLYRYGSFSGPLEARRGGVLPTSGIHLHRPLALAQLDTADLAGDRLR